MITKTSKIWNTKFVKLSENARRVKIRGDAISKETLIVDAPFGVDWLNKAKEVGTEKRKKMV